MQDVWSTVSTFDDITQERLAGVLETRGADPQQQAMRRAFLSDIAFPARARVLDVGCGTSVLTRVLARWPDVDEAIGVDPATSFLDKGGELAADVSNITFQEADGQNLPFDDARPRR